MVEEVISSCDDSQMNLGSRYGTSSTKPSGGDDDNDDDDAGGDGSNPGGSSGQGGDGGDYGGNEGWQDYRPEVEYTRPSQLEDEGPQRETRPVDRQYSRRKGKGKMHQIEEDAFSLSMESMSIGTEHDSNSYGGYESTQNSSSQSTYGQLFSHANERAQQYGNWQPHVYGYGQTGQEYGYEYDQYANAKQSYGHTQPVEPTRRNPSTRRSSG
ncbi:uncharacterized protein LOC131167807 [Malania oleifera]|uniref:uncharacterized protein LOC131167807 n=1 Tax=Malania oleifera TaxID=397392 RepID=UPI0025ADF160|nr:uncharacterized protein LOC131167807 [Malania oleifera]